MRTAFYLTAIWIWFFRLLGTVSDNADKKNYVWEPKQEECGEYTWWRNECMLNMINEQSLLIK